MAISKIENNSLASGVPSTAKLPAGTVLQVKSYSGLTANTITAASFTDLNYNVSITPTSATSKIFIVATIFVGSSGAGVQPTISLFRNSTNLGDTNYGFGDAYAGTYVETFGSLSYLDSPATTSSVTYGIYGRANNGGNNYFGSTTRVSTITVMEIAA